MSRQGKHPKPIVHNRDHEHGGADPVRIHFEDVGTSGGGTGGGIMFDTDPQAGGFLTATVTTGPMTLESTGPGDINIDGDQNVNLVGGVGVNLQSTGSGGIILDTTGTGDIWIQLTGTGTRLNIIGLPTTNPGGTGRVWNNGGVLSIT